VEAICALCHNHRKLIESHRIPKFVTRAIKKNSFTKKLRSTHEPDKAVQDSDKDYLLCSTCELLFSNKETLFNQKVLQPFRNKRITSFKYEEWLNYFITSVSWRTLYQDTTSEEKFIKNGFNEKSFKVIKLAEEKMREYLLGEKKFLFDIENHIVFICEETKINNGNYDYNTFCNGTFGYLFGNSNNGSLYVYHVLAGIMIISIIKKSPKERWKNTFVKNDSGTIKGHQIVFSPICNELEYQLDQIDRASKIMSVSQKQNLIDKINKDPEGFFKSSSAKGVRK
jgi:hypothetical protein